MTCFNNLFTTLELDVMSKKELDNNYCSTNDFYCKIAKTCDKNRKNQ